MHERPQTVDVFVKHANQLAGLVSEAEASLRPFARAGQVSGILVTRHEFHRFTVALDPSVPFGETWERSIL